MNLDRNLTAKGNTPLSPEGNGQHDTNYEVVGTRWAKLEMPPELPRKFQEMQAPLEQAEWHHVGVIIEIQMAGNSTKWDFSTEENDRIKKDGGGLNSVRDRTFT